MVSPWLTLLEANGHKILSDGTHLVCGTGGVFKVSADGKIQGKLAAAWNGKPMGKPNDLTLDRTLLADPQNEPD